MHCTFGRRGRLLLHGVEVDDVLVDHFRRPDVRLQALRQIGLDVPQRGRQVRRVLLEAWPLHLKRRRVSGTSWRDARFWFPYIATERLVALQGGTSGHELSSVGNFVKYRLVG